MTKSQTLQPYDNYDNYDIPTPPTAASICTACPARAENERIALKAEPAGHAIDQQRLTRLSALHELLGQIAVFFSGRDQPCMGMTDMLKRVSEFLPADLGFVLPVKSGGDWIRHPVWWHPPDTQGNETQSRRRFQKTLLQHLHQEQSLAQIAEDEAQPVVTLDLTHKGLGTVILFPVGIFGERHGVLGFRRSGHQAAWGSADLSLVRQLGEQFSRALERPARDLERQIAARRIMETAIVAKNANRSKSEFLARMSHEIRSPMSAIVGYTQMLTEGGIAGQEVEKIGGHIRRNAQHLLSLINDILDLSKIEAGHIQLRPARLNIRHLIDNVIDLMSAAAAEKGLTLSSVIDDDVPTQIHADELRLRQILINLIDNAVKYTDRGGVAITVRRDPITAEFLNFAVADSGIGIKKDDLAVIFSPFVQGEARENRAGTGLGLSIVHQLVTLMAGDISVQSQVGRGSLFSIRMPFQTEPQADYHDEERDDAPPDTAATHSLAGKNILLVDDGEDNRRILTYFLNEAGAQTTCATDGRAALALFTNPDPLAPAFDLVLMDMLMPHLDGYQATRQLRAMGVTTPIIALTAQAMVDDRAKCLDAGCDDYLAKPIAPKRLVQTLCYYLDHDRAKPNPTLVNDANKVLEDVIDPSPLWQHPKLKFIIADYVNAMDQSVNRLEAAIEEKDRRRLLDLAHRYHGNGASFGYPCVSQHAKILEEQLKAHATMDQCFASARALVKDLRYIHTHHRSLHQTGERSQFG